MSKKPHSITVTGQGTARATPSHFTINIGIEASRPSVREAYAETSAAVIAVNAVLLSKGGEQIAISSTSLDVRVETRWQEGLGNVVTGYTVATTLNVPLGPGRDAQDLIAAIVDTGNNSIRLNGLTPIVSDPTAAQDAARAAAWAGARRAAELYASLAGRTLGEVSGVEEVAVPMGGPRPMMARATSMAMDSLAMPMMLGVSDIMIDVQVTWLLT